MQGSAESVVLWPREAFIAHLLVGVLQGGTCLLWPEVTCVTGTSEQCQAATVAHVAATEMALLPQACKDRLSH